jgi:uncharacterized membrane protein YqhA
MMRAIFDIRYVSFAAVLATLLGAVLMFLVGLSNTFDAFPVFFRFEAAQLADGPNLEATVKVLTALDKFLFGLVLLYRAYSVVFLFIRRDASGSDVRIPEWLQVQDLGQMKKTMLEVIVVLLAVLFLIVGLENQYKSTLNWNLVLIPGGILAISGAIKLIDFKH